MPSPKPSSVAMFSAKMLIGTLAASTAMPPRATRTATPPTTTGTPAAIRLPKTTMSARPASGRPTNSLRWRSASDTDWMSP